MSGTVIIQPITAKIKSGSKTVLTSGTVHTNDPSQLTLEISDLTIHLQFAKDDKGLRIEPGPNKTGKYLPLILFNFENPIGVGSSQPIPIGALENRPLSFMFSVYTPTAGANRLLHFTFFLD